MLGITIIVASLIAGMLHQESALDDAPTVREVLRKTTVVAYPANGRPVDETVARAIAETLAPRASVVAVEKGEIPSGETVLRVALASESIGHAPSEAPAEKDWMYFRLQADGSGTLVTSRQHLLYALFCQVRDRWANRSFTSFENGRLTEPRFQWITGEDRFYGTRRRFSRHYDPEETIKELAWLGVSHAP